MRPLEDMQIEEIRERLRGWGTYGKIYDRPGGVKYGWRPLDVDAMTDEEIMEIARRIAERPPL